MIAARKPVSTSPYCSFSNRLFATTGWKSTQSARRGTARPPASANSTGQRKQLVHQLLAPGPTAAAARGSGRHCPAGPGARSGTQRYPIGGVMEAMVEPLSSMERPNGGNPGRKRRRLPPASGACASATPRGCWCGPSVSCSARPSCLCRCRNCPSTHLLPAARRRSTGLLEPVPGRSLLRLERLAITFDLVVGNAAIKRACWHLPRANAAFAALAGWLCPLIQPRCGRLLVMGERVRPSKGLLWRLDHSTVSGPFQGRSAPPRN